MPKQDDIRSGLRQMMSTPKPAASAGSIPAEHLNLWICTETGEIGKPKSVTGGSLAVEILLWLFFLLPGLIYSAWRLTTRKPGINGNTNIIKVDTPRGRQLYAQFHG